MPEDTQPAHAGSTTTLAPLSDYEAEQCRLIAGWKEERPKTHFRLLDQLSKSVAHLVERFVPAQVAKDIIEQVCHEAQLLATQTDIMRKAGIADLAELHHRPLQECDQLATDVTEWAEGIAVVGGAVTGAGGFLTSALDVPLFLMLALRTIVKMGHCYGYPLDHELDRRRILGILMVATTDDPVKKQRLIARIKEVEDWLIEEAEHEVIVDEAIDALLRIEIMDDVPGLGALTTGYQNYAFIHQVSTGARRVFQERWLRDTGKVTYIEPTAIEAEPGRSSGVTQWITGGAYYLSFGAMLPLSFVAQALTSKPRTAQSGATANDGPDAIEASGATARPVLALT